MDSWNLEDADEIAAKNKYTFYKPPPEAIAQVVPGEFVKLIFAFESDDPEAPHAERMWVVVDEVFGGGHFKGRLSNDPAFIKDLKFDDPLTFEARHIINCDHGNNDNLVERYIKRCFVTQRVLKRESASATSIGRSRTRTMTAAGGSRPTPSPTSTWRTRRTFRSYPWDLC